MSTLSTSLPWPAVVANFCATTDWPAASLEVSTVPAAAEPLAVVALPVVEPEAAGAVVATAGAAVAEPPVVAGAVVGAMVAVVPDAGAVVALVTAAAAVVLAGFGVAVALLPPKPAR